MARGIKAPPTEVAFSADFFAVNVGNRLAAGFGRFERPRNLAAHRFHNFDKSGAREIHADRPQSISSGDVSKPGRQKEGGAR